MILPTTDQYTRHDKTRRLSGRTWTDDLISWQFNKSPWPSHPITPHQHAILAVVISANSGEIYSRARDTHSRNSVRTVVQSLGQTTDRHRNTCERQTSARASDPDPDPDPGPAFLTCTGTKIVSCSRYLWRLHHAFFLALRTEYRVRSGCLVLGSLFWCEISRRLDWSRTDYIIQP